MLRSLMYDAKDGDRPFIEMMKDFVATYRNANASTEDFQRVAEKHIRPVMNLKGDGKLDWFFSEWVYGTALPKYKFDYTLTPDADGKWLLHANLTQSEVPAGFVMQVPVYVDLDGQMRRLGQIRMVGDTTATDVKVRLPLQAAQSSHQRLSDVLEQ